MKVAPSAPSRLLLCLIALLLAPLARGAADLSALWADRVTCVAAVEYTIQTEVERRELVAYGTVVDNKGDIVLPPSAINLRFTPDELVNFKVYLPGQPTGTPAEYLGVDPLSGWHFVRAAASQRAKMKPVTDFAAKSPAEPRVAEEVWGIGLRGKDEDFAPYLLSARVAMVSSLPQRTGIAQHEVSSPGLPVFNADGSFAGLALSSFGQSFVQFSPNDRGGTPIMLINVEESSAFLLAAECLPQLNRIPTNVFGRPLPWLGTYGLQSVDPEVARFLHLENQSAAVVSEVLEGSPAEKAGLKERDIIVAIDGKTLPRLRPDRVVTTYIDRAVGGRKPGDALGMTVLRDGKTVQLKVILGDAPPTAREAPHRYFQRLGISARAFVYSDAIVRRIKVADSTGIIIPFVKPDGPAAVAGLQLDDWVKEIDGVEIKSYDEAAARLAAIDSDPARSEFVLLVSRNGDTSIIRVKLK